MRTEFPTGFEEEIKKWFKYDPATGLFEKRDGRTGEWKPLATRNPQGTLICNIKMGGKMLTITAARVAFIIMTGKLPLRLTWQDGNKDNLKWSNIVEAQERQNVEMTKYMLGTTKSPEPLVPTEKLKLYLPGFLKGEKNPQNPLATGIYEQATGRELTPSELFELNQKTARQEESEQAALERAIAACHPIFAELEEAKKSFDLEVSSARKRYGIWTGMTISDLELFLAACNRTSLPLNLGSIVKDMFALRMSGQFEQLDKWEQDRWQGSVWMQSLRLKLLDHSDVEQKLAEYRWKDLPVPPFAMQWEPVEQAILSKHGFASITEAAETAYINYQKQNHE